MEAWGLRICKLNGHPSDAGSAGLVDADSRTAGLQLLRRTVALREQQEEMQTFLPHRAEVGTNAEWPRGLWSLHRRDCD